MKSVVFDALPYGRNNAIPWRDLVAQLGFSSKRELNRVSGQTVVDGW